MPPKMIDGLEVSNDQHLPEKADRARVLAHWKEHRPKYREYLRQNGVLMDAVKLAIDARENLFWTLVKKKVEPREAALQAAWYHTKLPTEERQPLLEPDQAPLGQPGQPELEQTTALPSPQMSA